MGCGASSDAYADPEMEKRNNQIDRELANDRQKLSKEVKILLLGAGESGKSTILKQMRLLKEGSPPAQERMQYREVIFSNAVQSMMVVIEAVDSLALVLNPALRPQADLLEELDPSDPDTTTSDGDMRPDLRDAIAALWQDDSVRKAVSVSYRYQLNDSASFFFDAIARIGSPQYVPTVDDILRSRVKSTGIAEAIFPLQGNLTGRIFDVGGQRSERKKWVHCFENVEIVFFVVAVNEYNQTLYEDMVTNRMVEAQTLFESISNSRWFSNSSILLFLNKTDLLEDKLNDDPFVNYMPEFSGRNTTADVCLFWKERFAQLYRPAQSWRTLITHATCATDTQQMQKVFNAVEQHIVESQLAKTGLL